MTIGADDEATTGDALTPAYGDARAVSVRWAVPPDCHQKTAIEALAHKVRRIGLERARRVVAGGDLRVDGRACCVDERLARGTVLELWRLPPDDPGDPMPTPTVLLRERGLIVVDKPGDLAVHPSARYLHRTLTGWLFRHGLRANPCHRLDRETSGVLVCAEPGPMEARVKGAFAAGRVEKEYLAVVRGVVARSFTVDAPLALQGERGLVRIRMVVDDAGRPACTDVEPVRSDGARTLVCCRPRTGRQHQLRAHLAHAGFPIVGDKLYAMGDPWFDAFTRRALNDEQRAALDAPRQALHAARLTLADEGLSVEAPLPVELAALVS
ncbi:MAG: RNA pseudouridine synthase [Deltaproteobacteria bacterium]|nr:RNA pseudouridine synthase [Deltaproteobacteria bacterium]